MDADNFIARIREYFDTKGKYSDAVIREMTKEADKFTNEDRVRLYNRIIEDNSPRFQIGLKEIREAATALGISYCRARYIPSRQYWCDCCGEPFQYAQYVSEEEREEKQIYDTCPICGFQPTWTIDYKKYQAMGKLSENYSAWYIQQKKTCLELHGKDKPYYVHIKDSPVPENIFRKPAVNEDLFTRRPYKED